MSKSSKILTIFGIAGTIGTSALAVKETPKAMRLLKVKKNELKTEKLSFKETIQSTWKCYIPATLLGVGTIACIVGIGVADRKSQAALSSAYALLNESYKKYRTAAKQVYGDDADDKIHAEMAKDAMVADGCWGEQIYNMDMDPESEHLLFYDLATQRYFNTTMAAVLNAQYHVNRNIHLRGYVSLNEYLSFLGLDEENKDWDDLGWDCETLAEEIGSYWLDFDNHKTMMEDGLECIVIGTMVPHPLEEE